MRVQVVRKPTVISTFAGCGGSSLGYQLAGFRELLAVEWDDNAVRTFRQNFPRVPVYHGDIASLSGAECMRLAGIAPGELDVLDGSPPCQGFSLAGKRRYDDPRNSLFREYARLLKELQPRVFVMENVPGMVSGAMKQVYLTIMSELRACGYKCKGAVLNAMYFHVPQARKRVIVIGTRNDLGVEPSHPAPQSRPMTFREATHDIWDEPADIPFNKDTKTARDMRMRRAGSVGVHYSHYKLHADKPGNTLQHDFLGYLHSWHPAHFRPLNLKEWSRIGSFPDSFIWPEKKLACPLIGNSVPPNLMRAVAERVKLRILRLAGQPC